MPRLQPALLLATAFAAGQAQATPVAFVNGSFETPGVAYQAEPTSAALAGIALLGLAGASRRRPAQQRCSA